MAIQVSSAAELMSALANATGGETILLQPGNYGALKLNEKFADTVTIKSADPQAPASFSSVSLSGVENLTFDSVKFDYVSTAGAPTHVQAVQINGGSHNITITNSIFDGDLGHGGKAADNGYGTGFGLHVSSSTDITLTNNEFFNWYRAAVFVDVDNLTIKTNDVHHIRSDGFNLVEVDNVLIQGNYIHDFVASKGSGDHPDMIQFWTTNTDSPSTNIVIRGNVLDSGTGDWTQSIFMRNELVDLGQAGKEMFYRNILIEDNLIYNAHTHGITVGETDGLTIRNNTVLQNKASVNNDSVYVPGIFSADDSTNVSVTNNITSKLSVHSTHNTVVEDNLIVQRTDPNGSNYYGNLFVNALADGNATPADLKAIPGGLIEQMGVGSSLTRSSGELPPADPPLPTEPTIIHYADGTHSMTMYDSDDSEQFTDYLVTYTADWQAQRIIFNYDDNTHSIISYDLADEYDYTDYLATFDSQWNLTRTIFTNDDGTHSVRHYDVSNDHPWALQQYEYDGAWNLLSVHGHDDNGLGFIKPLNDFLS